MVAKQNMQQKTNFSIIIIMIVLCTNTECMEYRQRTVIGIESAKKEEKKRNRQRGMKFCGGIAIVMSNDDEKAEKLKIHTNNDSLIHYHRQYIVVRCGGFEW